MWVWRCWVSICLVTVVACGGAVVVDKKGTARPKKRPRPVAKEVEPARPADGEPGSDRVALSFGWPHAMSMSVRVTHQRQRDREQARSAVTYKMGVAETERGLRISYAGYLPYLQVPGARPTEQHGMRERLASLVPSLLTDKQGKFSELPELALSPRKKRLKALKVKGKWRTRMAAKAVANDGLTRAARRFWDDRVGRWHGHPMMVRGEEQEEPDVLHVPELGGASVLAVTRYRFVDWVKCNEGAEDASCAEIHLETTPEPEALAKAVQAFRKRRGRFQGALVTDVDKKIRAELITEPRTLRPHRYKEARFTMVGLRDRHGNESQSMTTDTQVELYE